MLTELRVEQLGVIEKLDIVLEAGLTVLTGETGAGKTLVVGALELLLGARADPTVVRAGAPEAIVEGRFVTGDDELVLQRIVPASGRSRASISGRMAPQNALVELGAELVDLYGQHAHQSLLRPGVQRAALDRFAGSDLGAVEGLRRAISAIDEEIGELGGDRRERTRELDLLGYQLSEIDAVSVVSPDEDGELAAEELVLSNVAALRQAAELAHGALAGSEDRAAVDLVGLAVESLGAHEPLAALEARLRGVAAELDDIASDLRHAAEGFEEDPGRLEAVRERRRALQALRRKYGETLRDVLAFAANARARAEAIGAADETLAALEARRTHLEGELVVAEQVVGDARRKAATGLSAAVEVHLRELALPRAEVHVSVPPTGIGDDVELLFSANAGEATLPLAKVASGGELARAMLALRLVLSEGPPTLVFDEVDAGIGGAAAIAVGRALAALGRDHQVLVVTHLAQVAAHADHQFVVEKEESGERTVARVTAVSGKERIAELSRMLSGHPESAAARRHASELLATAQATRLDK